MARLERRQPMRATSQARELLAIVAVGGVRPISERAAGILAVVY
jgi:hypothetical protein